MRKEVEQFANAMEERLKENDHKHHWSNYTPAQMFERLKDEIEELSSEIREDIRFVFVDNLDDVLKRIFKARRRATSKTH